MFKILTWIMKQRYRWYFRNAHPKAAQYLIKDISQMEPNMEEWRVYYWAVELGKAGRKLVKALGPENSQKVADEWLKEHPDD